MANEDRPSLTYRDAGVDLDAKERAFGRIKKLVHSTYRPEVVSELGSFGGLFALGKYDEPILVSSVDSVGTKLKIAFAVNRHDTVGYDIVAHCGNDIVAQGAEPLFFLDYIGIGDLDPDVVQRLMEGLAQGCRDIGCALIGGETAELPDLYATGEYDLAGCIVGVAERSQIVTGEAIRPGDAIIGLPSVGLHTNGYSLARKVVFETAGLAPTDPLPGFDATVGEELLKPHKSYVKSCLSLRDHVGVNGLAHITGGGLPDNVRRVLPRGCQARVRRGSWDEAPIFDYLQRAGNIADDEMFHVFNMGVGMVVIVAADSLDDALEQLRADGESPVAIGEIVSGDARVEIV